MELGLGSVCVGGCGLGSVHGMGMNGDGSGRERGAWRVFLGTRDEEGKERGSVVVGEERPMGRRSEERRRLRATGLDWTGLDWTRSADWVGFDCTHACQQELTRRLVEEAETETETLSMEYRYSIWK